MDVRFRLIGKRDRKRHSHMPIGNAVLKLFASIDLSSDEVGKGRKAAD